MSNNINLKQPLIGLAGNIGVGKTTFTKIISKRFGWHPFFESVSDNPYLKDFYENMERWSFNLQIYFLQKRFIMHKKMEELDCGAIQDRTIYEDVEIFARNLYKTGKMSNRDWNNYRDLFSAMTSYLKPPNLIIYLKGSTDTLLSRIKNRNRNYERTIKPEYINNLNNSYERWIKSVKDYPLLTIETDDFNIHNDIKQLTKIEKQIRERI